MEIARLAPRKIAALICYKVKQVQAVRGFIRLYNPSMGPPALTLTPLLSLADASGGKVGQLRVYKARTSVERTLWNVY